VATDALPRALVDLIEAFQNLPGVGARTAERYALAALKQDPAKAKKLALALNNLHSSVKLCPKTFALIDADLDVSPLYDAPDRDRKIVAVVEEPFDVLALENTGAFKGTYHVLGGAISPIDGITPEQLHIPQLIQRLIDDEVEELILATGASVEGESTALYIQQNVEAAGLSDEKSVANSSETSEKSSIDASDSDSAKKSSAGNPKRKPIKITRLARGLPVGLDLEYADQITLARALSGRREI
jgi:recombination protein RecR